MIIVKLPMADFEAESSPHAQPVELPTAHTTPPKVNPTPQTPTWQTKELVPRKTGGRRPYAMKQVDVLAPVGIAPQGLGPPGLGPPDPARLLALDTSSNVVYEDTEGGPSSVLASDLTDMPKSTRQTVVTTKSDPSGFVRGPTSVEPYSEFKTRCNADDSSTTVFEHIQTPSGHVNERLAEDMAAGPQRKGARRSAIRKVQPAQIESKALCMLVCSVALTFLQMSKQTAMWNLTTPTAQLTLPISAPL
jgi:hypothetical protein